MPEPEEELDEWDENDEDDDPPETPVLEFIGDGGARITFVKTPPLPSFPEDDDDEELYELWKLFEPPDIPVFNPAIPVPRPILRFPRLNPLKSIPWPDPEVEVCEVTTLEPPIKPALELISKGVPEDVCVVV